MDRLLVLGGDVGDNQVLIRRQAEYAFVNLGDLAQCSLERLSRLVLNAAILNESGKVTTSIMSRLPAELIDIRSELVRASGLKLVPEVLLDFCHEAFDAHAIDSVLDTGILSAKEKCGVRIALLRL